MLGAVAGCARPPRPLQGEFPPLSVGDAQAASHLGDRVRWGGTIVATRPETDRTCVEIVARPLDRRARPRTVDQVEGRFRACTTEFLDPEVYAPKRELTVVGTIDAVIDGKIGNRDYPFPQVAAESIYLWPLRPVERDFDYYGGYYGAGPYWGPAWGLGVWGYPYPYSYFPRGGFGHHHRRW